MYWREKVYVWSGFVQEKLRGVLSKGEVHKLLGEICEITVCLSFLGFYETALYSYSLFLSSGLPGGLF